MKIFRAYLYKLLRSPLFYIGMIVTALVFVFGDDPVHGSGGRDVATDLEGVLYVATMRKLVAIFGALPFAANFADEWTNRVTTGCVSRCGVKKYAVSNVVMCFISSLVTVFLGMMLFAVGKSFFKPVFYDIPDYPLGRLEETIMRSGGVPWVYIMYRSFVFASSCAMWSVMGMMLTAFFPNKYVGLCSPFVASYIVERFSMLLPLNFNLWIVSLSNLNWENVWGKFFYSVGLFTALAAVCGFVFVIMVKRRVQNEVA